MGRGAVNGQEEGLVAPEDEDPQDRGRTVAPGMTPLGESGRDPLMVVGAEQRVKQAGQDVVTRGGLEIEAARRVPGG